jgi:hypothetical protein
MRAHCFRALLGMTQWLSPSSVADTARGQSNKEQLFSYVWQATTPFSITSHNSAVVDYERRY